MPFSTTSSSSARRRRPPCLWANVKANGYGHGAVQVAEAALQAGASGLCVALVQEGVALRDAAASTARSSCSASNRRLSWPSAIRAGLDLTVYSYAQLHAIAAAGGNDHPVHLKVDTGMRRVGAGH